MMRCKCACPTDAHITYPNLRTKKMQTECTRCTCFVAHNLTIEQWQESTHGR